MRVFTGRTVGYPVFLIVVYKQCLRPDVPRPAVKAGGGARLYFVGKVIAETAEPALSLASQEELVRQPPAVPSYERAH